MARIVNQRYDELTAGGGTINYSMLDNNDSYVLWGNATLSSSWTIQHDPGETPSAGLVFDIFYAANMSRGVNAITIFGYALSTREAAQNQRITAVWDSQAVAFVVYVWPDFEAFPTIETDDIVDRAITNVKLDLMTRGTVKVGGTGNAPTDLDAKTAGNIMLGDGTDVKSTAMSGDVTINAAGVTAIGALKVATSMVQASAITAAEIGSQAIIPSKMDNATGMSSYVFVFPVSFESGEQCENAIFSVPFAYTLDSVVGQVTKALAATDDGIITPTIAGVPIGTTLDFPASSVLNASASITSLAAPGALGSKLHFTTSKATAGGRVLLTVKLTRV